MEDHKNTTNISNGRPTKGIKQQIPDELVLFADKSQDRVNKNFGEFMRKNGLKNVDILKNLYPIISGADHVSKLLSGVRNVNLSLLVVLHYQYGVDLNEFIAGDKSKRPPLTPKQVEELRAIVSQYDS